ncbi:MAG: hypothetical protein E7301_04480 [Butyrivibrio sp.]|uniref:hypothetical protein n=1 Tax=Butyrivibrio sp. NC2002 TaxID=1410610 RepID=UPI00056809F4|nr:hypothetical protein [Butyrivibrio sp. NC2002]MBE5859366.1 hypothetical protein [Butyrivibrio sp.]
MEGKSVFRKKSLERVSSPEQLNDYIQVTTFSVWIVLLSTIILLAGIMIWGFFGEIHVNTENGEKTVAPITCILE